MFGAAYGGMNVAMNSAAVDLVASLRRPVMPSFHAAFSLGGMIGAGLGGLVAGGLSASAHLFVLAGIGLLVTAFAGPRCCATAGHAAPRPRRALPRQRLSPRVRRVVVLFGVIALCTAYGEGALADWGALHLEQDLGAHPGVAAAGYAVFALTMTAGRLTGTLLLERLGQTRTLVLGGATAAAGMLLGSLAPTAWAALAGFAVTGLGLANIFPSGGPCGRAGGPERCRRGLHARLRRHAARPPAIGFLADWFSLPLALTTVALLAAAAAALGYGARNATSDAHA